MRFGVFLVDGAGHLAASRASWFELAAYPAYVGSAAAADAWSRRSARSAAAASAGSTSGSCTLQPSELMKPCIVLVLARFYDSLPPGDDQHLARAGAGRRADRPAGRPGACSSPTSAPALAIAFGGVVVMFLAGLPLRWFVGGGARRPRSSRRSPSSSCLHDYQRNRVTIFLDPESDPLGTGYHITQSKIAIGSGGISGKGFGNGSQSHLDYLPEPHTDFVFATMAEEWGLIGGLFVLLVFGIVLRWGWTRGAPRARPLLAAARRRA